MDIDQIFNFSRIENQATFILGHARSGTSLLVSLLDNHHELVVFPGELKFFKRIKNPSANKFLLNTDFHLCFNENRHAIEGINYQDIQDVLHKRIQEAKNKREILLSIIRTYAEIEPSKNSRKKRWIEKTPANTRFVPTLEKWFPGTTKYIYIMRDPRDVFASLKSKHPNYNLKNFCNGWTSQLRIVDLIKKKVCERFYLLRYEDLVENPETTLEKLADFLKIEFCSEMKVPTMNGIPWTGNSKFFTKFDGVDSRSTSKYLERLKSSEIAEIEGQLKRQMKQYRYSSTNRAITNTFPNSLLMMMRYLIHLAEWQFPVLQKLLMR